MCQQGPHESAYLAQVNFYRIGKMIRLPVIV